MRHFVTICTLAGALLIPVVGLRGADESGAGNIYEKTMARAAKAGTLILFVYSTDTGENLSEQAKGVLLAKGKRTVTARIVVQFVPIDGTDRRYANYRGRIKGQSYPFWVLTKPDGEFLAGGDYDTVISDGTGSWKKTVAGLAKKFPPIGAKARKRIAKMLAQAQADLDAGGLGKVKRPLGKLGRVWYPKELAAQCTALRNAYDDKLRELTDRPGQLLAERKLVEAALAYQRLIDAFGSSDNEAKAARKDQQQLLTEYPEIRSRFTEQLRQRRAQAAAKAAGKPPPVADGSKDQAGNEAGQQAEADTPTPAPETPDEAALERRAASLVKLAQMYHGRDMIEKAKAKLTQCVETYPNTEAAEQARKLLRRWQ
ncbi:hypothetical protein LCGC14_0647510 [marine sediment metagenome]|uniref:Uncharacterized protein n=1 Tax=marine sediment metagenome TaxID=412755 RepID=A0A0F9R2K0_9ZZZZ|nr:hypothetical protein [Phycisphaerae bacterium]HDZ43973.1 hypothetical protein [Phycisphaerae bacterium]